MVYDKKAQDKRRIQDSDGDEVEISSLGYTFSAEAGHARINNDREYFVQHTWSAVTAGSEVTFTIVTNAKYPHGYYRIASNAEFSYSFDLGLAKPGLMSTEVFPRNLNRGVNLNRSVASFYYGDRTTSNLSMTLETGHVGAADKFTSIASMDTGTYWTLDSGCTYHLRVTNEDDAASYIVVKYQWHEHGSPHVTGGLGEDAVEYS